MTVMNFYSDGTVGTVCIGPRPCSTDDWMLEAYHRTASPVFACAHEFSVLPSCVCVCRRGADTTALCCCRFAYGKEKRWVLAGRVSGSCRFGGEFRVAAGVSPGGSYGCVDGELVEGARRIVSVRPSREGSLRVGGCHCRRGLLIEEIIQRASGGWRLVGRARGQGGRSREEEEKYVPYRL